MGKKIRNNVIQSKSNAIQNKDETSAQAVQIETGNVSVEAELSEREAAVFQREQAVAAKEVSIEKQKAELRSKLAAYAAAVAQLDAEKNELNTSKILLETREKLVDSQVKKQNAYEAKLVEREANVRERENKIGTVESAEKATLLKIKTDGKIALEKEISDEREKAYEELGRQLDEKRKKFDEYLEKRDKERLDALNSQIKEIETKAKKEAKTITSAAEKEANAKLVDAEKIAERIIGEKTKEIIERNSKLEKLIENNINAEATWQTRKEELDQREIELTAAQKKNERKQRRLTNKETELETYDQELKDRAAELVTDKIANLEAEIGAKDEALQSLRQKMTQMEERLQEVESFKVSVGQDPVVIQNKITCLNTTIDNLKKELATRAPAGIEVERQALNSECQILRDKVKALEMDKKVLLLKNEQLQGYEILNISLDGLNKQLKTQIGELQSQADKYIEIINRYNTKEARLSDREERIKQIRTGYLGDLIGANKELIESEIEWLDTIGKRCDDYEIHFPQRILYAFHTALKISDWSSITVLAGVSGTGKSELPKLYSAFGGLNFINIPVQPSWDSQESMLGFFNSIDNRFEPEPLLRYLVQCTEDDNYKNYMSIVLLDEMNLAHVEHYFADFLSKLETRRGMKEVPAVEVKLGAGVEPYELKLERTILWTGTMNQDETTKSLSDKVLDRGLVINFPRPRILVSRKGMKNLDKAVLKTSRPMITRAKWEEWIIKIVDLEGEQMAVMESYKRFVEELNDELEKVGRSLGHRVWQSIEHYIVNYPTVAEELRILKKGAMSGKLREAMKVAFEDQIVQKIMPKLRGVETRGRSKATLDTIEKLLEDNGFERLKDDFEIACEQGYGQFIWSSAKYIEADEVEKEAHKSKDNSEDIEAEQLNQEETASEK